MRVWLLSFLLLTGCTSDQSAATDDRPTVADATLVGLSDQWRREIKLPPCQLQASGGSIAVAPMYDRAFEWRRGGQVVGVLFLRENTLDAYGRLELTYKGGQLQRVEERTTGFDGADGRIWLLRGGRVRQAKTYSQTPQEERVKTVKQNLPLNSLPALYRMTPQGSWYGEVACRPF